MSRKSQVVSIVAIVIFALFLTGNFPQMSREEKCDLQAFRKLADSEKQICVKVGDKFEFVDVLTTEDIYSFTNFCLTLVAASNKSVKPNCSYFENVAMDILEYKFPRDSCIKYLRGFVFAVDNLLVEYPSRGENFDKKVAKWSDENIYSSGCYSR